MYPTSSTTRARAWQFAGGAIVVAVAFAAIVANNPARAVPQSLSPDQSTFVPIVNCRLFDTRPESTVGTRSTPIGPDEVHQQQVTGSVGECNIPGDATAIALNVTTAGPTAASFLTVFPYAPTPPGSSNLNYLPGSPPTPNKVDVKLSAAGQLGFYNFAGSVHVLADATGYYTNAVLGAMNGRLNDLSERLDAAEGQVDSLSAQLSATEARLNIGRSFALSVDADGSPISPGPYTSEKGGFDGLYFVTYDFAAYEIPKTRFLNKVHPVIVASPERCGATVHETYSINTDRLGATGDQPPNDVHGKVKFRVMTYDESGALADCGFHAVIAFEEPSPFIIGVTP